MYFWLTDKCFLLLLVVSWIIIINSLRSAHSREIYACLFRQPLALSSSIILGFFLVIGILDSVHSKVDDLTYLDKLLAPVGQMEEKTYSAPFALNLYASEVAVVNDKVMQIKPRLVYPPKNIQTQQQRRELIGHELLFSFLWSVGACLFFSIFLLKMPLLFKTKLISLITFFSCVLAIIICYRLSRYFHIFGTGKTGQDIFYFTVKSIRTGLVIGTLTTLFMMPFALILGVMSGYFGGWIDDIIQYIYTTLSSIPGILLITASVLSMQTYVANHPSQFTTLNESADARLLILCLILGVTSWTSLCRLLRAETLKLREIDFIHAAKALGSSTRKILFSHLLPNVMPIVIITVVLDFSYLVLAEAVLSYVGVGVSPMTISWGNMINGARLELARDPIVWWPMTAAFVVMFVMVLACNLFADAVRDAIDPHHI